MSDPDGSVNRCAWILLLLASVLPLGAAAEVSLPQGVALHYNFDEVEDGVVKNQQGPIPDGKVKDARFVPVEGFGQAFSGRQNDLKTNYVEVADDAAFNAQTFTVAAWVSPRRVDVSGSITCKHDWLGGGGRGFTMRMTPKSRMNFTVGAGGWQTVDTKSLLSPNTWSHVAATFDGTTMKIYFNGKVEERKKLDKKYTPSPYPMRIGHGAFALERHRKFDGKIDDVMFWDRTLKPDELKKVFEATREGRPPPPTEEQIMAIAKRLGHDGFVERITAEKELINIGPAVVPVLKKHTNDPNTELRARIRKIIRKLTPAS